MKIFHKEKKFNISALYSYQAAEKSPQGIVLSVNEAPNAHLLGTPHEAYDEMTLSKALNVTKEVIR